MSAYNFWWNAVQANEIDTLEQQVEQLRKEMDTARAWIEYLHGELQKVKNDAVTIRREEA